ncbi:hypothetical protein BC941DRAFT_431821 [Chlamydoabsidia padenii]|nr:hypothetical protein BC941DRAFT_431821 [Chlamydoabsidia padenii]
MVSFGLFSRRLMHEHLATIHPHLQATCQLEPLTFTHYGPVDRFLCILVVFFRRAMDDYMGLQVTRVLLGLFGTVQAIMAVEGSRNGYSWYHVMSWFMLWGMLANLITIAMVSCLLWMPIFVLTSRSFVSRIRVGLDDASVPVMISPARSAAILISLLLAFGVPSVYMTFTSLVERGSWLSLQIIALWQFCPILIQATYTTLTWILTPLLKDDRVMPLPSIQETAIISSSTSTSTTTTTSSATTRVTRQVDIIADQQVEDDDVNQQRQRVRMAQCKAGVEQLYLFMMIINALIYYGTFMKIQMDGVYLKDSLILLATKTIPAPGLGDIEIAQFSCAHFLFLDLVVLTLSFSFWALYEDGFLVFIILVGGIVLIGPGSAIAAYAIYRENSIQDPNRLKLQIKKTN